MPPELAVAHSGDRRGHCRTRAFGVRFDGHCGRAVRMARRCTKSPSLIHTIHHRASVRPDDSPRTLALRIPPLRVAAGGAAS